MTEKESPKQNSDAAFGTSLELTSAFTAESLIKIKLSKISPQIGSLKN
jgi:hypothetical protein